MWVGVWNKDLDGLCEDGTSRPCDFELYWTDGEVIKPESWISLVANISTSCFAMYGNGRVGDENCRIKRPFLCELDCSNVYEG